MSRTEAMSRRDRGAVAVMTSLLVLPLVLCAAFATDLGLWLHRARELQSAADLAALAGASHMPDRDAARTAAIDTLTLNGIDTTDPDLAVAVSFPQSGLVEVTITDNNVQAFLSRPVVSQLSISKSATATYLPPIALGSPSNVFGASSLPVATTDQQLFASIGGPQVPKQQGEAYTTNCAGPSNDCTESNNLLTADGYWYAIDVGASAVGTVTVEVFDAAWFGDRCDFPDENCDLLPWGGDPAGIAFEVYAADSTPHLWQDNPTLGSSCQRHLRPEVSPELYDDRWAVLCSFVATEPGIYPLSVRTSMFEPWVVDPVASGDQRSMNSYSLRVRSTGAGAPRLYGLGSIGFLAPVTTDRDVEYWLAEVDPGYAGHILEVGIFDPGEVPDNTTLELRDPDGRVPTCTYALVDHNLLEDPRWRDLSPCRFTTGTRNPPYGGQPYNNHWLLLRVSLPADYDCDLGGTGCYWTVFQNLDASQVDHRGDPLQATERQSWTVRVLGDPIRLVD